MAETIQTKPETATAPGQSAIIESLLAKPSSDWESILWDLKDQGVTLEPESVSPGSYSDFSAREDLGGLTELRKRSAYFDALHLYRLTLAVAKGVTLEDLHTPTIAGPGGVDISRVA